MRWTDALDEVDWHELSQLYKIAPLGDKRPDDLKLSFSNSRYHCFVFDDQSRLMGVGRALADGVDCAYICDVAVHPRMQGRGLGKTIIRRLRDRSAGHRKIILYTDPGKEGFYARLGFRRMRTAMAIFKDPQQAAALGLVEAD